MRMTGVGALAGAIPPAARAIPSAAGAPAANLRVAQMNLWNLFDPVDDPATGDMVLTPEQYQTKLVKIAAGIKELGLPDVISVNEVENEKVLADLLAQPGIKEAGYRFILQPPNDARGIRTAMLYRAERLEQVTVEHPNPKMSFPDGGKGQIDRTLLWARPPLVVDFRMRGAAQAADGAGLITIAVNHFKSKLGGAAPEARRQMQGQYLGEWLDARAAVRPGGATIVLGDLNANYGEGAYEKLANRADGTKRFHDAPLALDAADRYTYIYRGRKDMLDHLLVSAGKADAIKAVKILHVNAGDEGKKHQWDPSKLAGFSDHDPIVVDFDVAKLLAPATP